MQLLPWYSRFWSATLRAFGLEKPTIQQISLGTDFAGYPSNGFSPASSKEALAEFGWVYAAETAIASDLSRLPWKLSRKNRFGGIEQVTDHPFLDLLANPSPRTPSILIEQQLWLDLLLSGACYALVTWDQGEPVGLLWLAVDRIEPVASPQGELDGIRWNGRSYYSWQTLLYCRQPSWRSDPALLAGQGHIEALQHSLTAYWHCQERLKASSEKGRPSVLISPDKAADPAAGTITEAQVKAIRERLTEAFREGTGGAAVVARPLQVERLDFSPEELQAVQTMQELQKEILGVTGCVPVRLGSDAQNYATALEQRKGYWGDTLQGYAALLGGSLTMLGRRLYGDPSLVIEKDFSGIAVLQQDELTRLQRINLHIQNGMTPKEAYSYEGLPDAPLNGGSPLKAVK